jgi:membrane protease YdiL (CAAX protease family)
MNFAFVYYPFQFYLITLLSTFLFGFVAAYLSYRSQIAKTKPLLIISIFVPCITALSLIFLSGNKEMIQDFLSRLMLFKIHLGDLSVILFLMPCVILVATTLSLIFGYSSDQFCCNPEFSVMKGWGFLGIFIPLLLAPLIEELGWRGYGVDSLRSHFNLFTTSLIFGSLWALWHLPLFFIKGYYHNQLCELGAIYVVNFFVSVFVVAFLMNWIYYLTDRSIPAVILFHSILNLSSMLLKTAPFTKCIATVLLCVVLIIILVQNKTFFFSI